VPKNPFVILFLVCLALGAALFAAAWFFQGGAAARPQWVLLEAPETIPDRDLAAAVEGAGISPVCESATSVLLNDFDEVKTIPLDRYADYVEDFDPRNDGFAEKLRAYFVAGGKRRFFLDCMETSPAEIEKRLKPVLAEFEGAVFLKPAPGGSGVFPTAALAAFLCAALLFVLSETAKGTAFVRKLWKSQAGPGFFFGALCAAPVLAPLALAGAPGVIGAGLLAAAFCLSKPLFGEYFRSYRRGFRHLKKTEFWELCALFPQQLAASLACLALYVLCCVLGKIHPFVAAAPAILLFPVTFNAWKADATSLRNVFFPLPITGKIQLKSLFPLIFLVFLLAAVPAFFLRPYSAESAPGQAPSGTAAYGPMPAEAEFRAHAEFQASFSRRPLHGGEAAYGSYVLGEDGLLSPAP
jgi:hypothetical protein